MFNQNTIDEAAVSFRSHYDGQIDRAIVLGSGLANIGEHFDVVKEIGASSIANLKKVGVEAHKGGFLVCKYADKTLLIVQGRVHLYEGYSAFDVSLPIAMLGAMGVPNLILTNAAGGINPDYKVGDIMSITDHINLQGESPLVGIPDSSRFMDMTKAYSDLPTDIVKKFGVHKGIYAGVRGPHFETPAEIRYMRTIGADAVGMSTIMETVMARYYEMRVFGLSFISNPASGMGAEKLSHQDVFEASKMGADKMLGVIKMLVEQD